MLGIGKEAAIFFYACVSGGVIICAYEILRLFRKIVNHSLLAVGVEDFFFWIGVSIYLFRQIYNTTYGSIRWFFVLGVVLGIIIANFVRSLIGKLYKKIRKKSLKK